ncbi:nucleotide-diphospho-sugar transferase [Dendryphion nanum]|uniref:Nucleotide-diphospho-sugar transferase n=1 Tax=Dendryphion nanum TaxID=256645 RepID=A0A9P9EFY4_9PLEO|nr:nucleotide-diphospho-sugar transferase [Dendryphion nanum]
MHLEFRKVYPLLVLATLMSGAIYIYILGYSQPLPTLQLPFNRPQRNSTERRAYATFLGGSTSKGQPSNVSASAQVALQDPYFISVRLLNYQILHAEKTKTSSHIIPFVVLALPNVPRSQVAVLEAEGATVVGIEPLDLPDAFDKDYINDSRFRDVLSKLRLWQLTDYDKIVYLDADSFLLQNLDALFTDPELSPIMKTLPSGQNTTDQIPMPETYLMAASADTYGDQTEWEEPGHVNYLCACFMLFSPSNALFEYYISVLTGSNAPPNAAYPEQDLLIYVHRNDGPMPWRRIPIQWSANDGEMNDELILLGGVKSLHVKGFEGAEGGNVASEKYKAIWRDMVAEMEGYFDRHREPGNNK